MQTEIRLNLPDGRNLAYAEYGQPDGYPVIFPPRAQLITYRDDGHVSTYINHFDDIANALVPE